VTRLIDNIKIDGNMSKSSSIIKNVALFFWRKIFDLPQPKNLSYLESGLSGRYNLGKIRGLKSIRFRDYLFIEQNPNKINSEWAKKARKGMKIMWVIDLKKDKYIARVVDGKFEILD